MEDECNILSIASSAKFIVNRGKVSGLAPGR